jgi:hypothetical protein
MRDALTTSDPEPVPTALPGLEGFLGVGAQRLVDAGASALVVVALEQRRQGYSEVRMMPQGDDTR